MIKNRFRFKLTVAFSSIAILPLLIIGVVAMATIYHAGVQNAIELENQSLLHAREKINKFISDRIENTKLIVKGFDDLADLSNSQKMFFIDGFIKENLDVLEIVMLDKNGNEVAKKRNYRESELSDLISQSKMDSYNIAKDENIYYGPVDRTLFDSIMTLGIKVLNEDEDFIGVNVIKVKTKFLTDYIEQLSIGGSGYFLLVDENGYFISDGGKFNSLSPLFKRSQYAKFIEPQTLKESSFYEQRDFNNQQVIVGEILVDKKLRWNIVVVWPKNDALALVQTITLEVVAAILIGLLLVLFLSSFLSRQVLRPLEFLREKAKLIGKGHLDQEIKIDTDDEIEDLGNSFNTMAKGLREIKKLKDEFVYIAAHELRTPVTAIRGYLSMALGNDFGKLSPALEATLKKINGANEQLMRLVNDLLEIARAEAQNTEIEVSKVDLVSATQTVVDSLGAWAQMSGIKIIYERPKSALYVIANENKLVEILNNFSSNAIKYNKQGGLITIRHQVKRDKIVTEVQDTGIGMTKKELSRLFEKFYRAKNEKAIKVSGTGLGLFIAKQLVEKMGGKVFVESTLGKGSTFSFALKKA
jgi:signal transduction histidine kinase